MNTKTGQSTDTRPDTDIDPGPGINSHAHTSTDSGLGTGTGPGSTPGSGFAVQLAVGLASFLTPFLNSALSVAAPTIGAEFVLGPPQLALMIIAQLISAAALMMPFGRLSDFLGRRPIFLCGSAIFSGASLLICLSASPAQLIAARFLQGVGDAMTFGVSAAILVAAVPSQQRGRALGVNLAFIYAGLALGPLLGGMFTTWLSWRFIFALTALLGVCAFVLVARFWKEARPAPSSRYDWLGAALFAPGTGGFILALTLQPSWTATLGMAAALGLAPLFLAVERRHPDPLLPEAIFRSNPRFSLANLTSALGYTAAFSCSFLMSLYFQNVRGMTPNAAGLLMLIQPVVQMVCSPLAGILADRCAPARLASVGLVLLASGLFLLGTAGATTPMVPIAGFLVLQGVGFAFFASPNMSAIMACVPGQRHGLASGLLATMRSTGMSLSMALTGMLLAAFVGTGRGPEAAPQILVSLKVCFALFGVIALAGAVVSWLSARQTAVRGD